MLEPCSLFEFVEILDIDQNFTLFVNTVGDTSASNVDKPSHTVQHPASQNNTALRQTQPELEGVFNMVRTKLEDWVSLHDNPKSIARKIIKVLHAEYDLSLDVKVEAFIQNDSDEVSKTCALLAIATQRASSLFALQQSLITETTNELTKHIQQTKAFFEKERSWDVTYYMTPLEREFEKLTQRSKEADTMSHQSQHQYRLLREQATQTIMQQLQSTNRKYKASFQRIPRADLAEFCDAVLLLQQQAACCAAPHQNIPTQQQQLKQIQKSNSRDESNSTSSYSVSYLQKLYQSAVSAQTHLPTILQHIQHSCNANGIQVKIEMGELKTVERAMEKAVEEYQGDFSRLVDLVRASVECSTIQHAIYAVKALVQLSHSQNNSQTQPRRRIDGVDESNSKIEPNTNAVEVEILRVKNRLAEHFPAAAESGGYRDLLINLRTQGHVCELQIHLSDFVGVKKGGGHKEYSIARTLHLLDSGLGQVRVNFTNHDTTHAATDNMLNTNTDDDGDDDDVGNAGGGNEGLVRGELKQALGRVINGTCQGLHLNHATITTAEWKAVKDALQSPASSVKELYLPNCSLNAAAGTVLCEGTDALGCFRVVDLLGNWGVTSECINVLISDELEKLSLEDCNLSGEVMRQVIARLGQVLPRMMTDLSFNENTLGPEVGFELMKVLHEMPRLTSLDLSHNKLGASAFELAGVLKRLPKMTCLRLWDNDIGAVGAQALAPSLVEMTNMTWLELGDNNIATDGAKAIASSLAVMTRMQTLHLYGNNIGADGATAIASSLGVMINIHTLNLSDNNIGADGATAIASSLAVMTSIHVLTFYGNNIGADGAKAIASSLAAMTSLQELRFSGNNIGDDGATAIATSLNATKAIHTLSLHNNAIGSRGAQALLPALSCLSNLKLCYLMGNNIEKSVRDSIQQQLSFVDLRL